MGLISKSLKNPESRTIWNSGLLRGDGAAPGKGSLAYKEAEAPEAISLDEQGRFASAGKQAFEAGEYDLAIASYSRLLRGAPEAPTAAYAAHAVAHCQLQKGDYEAAIRAAARLEEAYGDSTVAAPSLLIRARCEHLLGRYDEARATLLRIRQAWPEYGPDTIEMLLKQMP